MSDEERCPRRSLRSTNIGDALNEMADELNTDETFFLAELGDVIDKIDVWNRMLPDVQPFYAVKANADPVLLKLMVYLGLKFDCASKGEIEAVLEAGAQPSDIVYAQPFKSAAYLKYASDHNVDLMTYDSDCELYKIKHVYPTARLLLRFRVLGVPCKFALSDKFGCDIDQCEYLLDLARTLGLNVVGISFHVGSYCLQPSAYAKAISMAREVFDTASKLGFNFEVLDIGGGFPGHLPGSLESFKEMSYYVKKGLAEHFPDRSRLKVIAEPGCFFVHSAFTFCTTVTGKRWMTKSTGTRTSPVDVMYYLNDGVYGTFVKGFELYGYRMEPVMSQAELQARPQLNSKIWGGSCCCTDCIFESCPFPEVNVGERIAFYNMGAYTSCLASTFNGFPLPRNHFIYKENDKIFVVKFPEDSNSPLVLKELKAFVRHHRSHKWKKSVNEEVAVNGLNHICIDEKCK